MALTSNKCPPRERLRYCCGLVQGEMITPSMRHQKVEPASLLVNSNTASLLVVGLEGWAVMVVSGGVKSTYWTEAAWSAAGMTRALVLAVLALLAVPVQPLICQPGSGTAPLRVMFSPATYFPFSAQAADLSGSALGLLPLPVCERVSV